MPMRLDHVMMAVLALDRSAARLREDLGLDSVDGGPHPGWGTANRLVPLGEAYLELIAVVDPTSEHPIAKVVGAAAAQGDRLLAACCEVDDLAALAERLGTSVLPGSRTYADGTEVTWRLTGVEAALTDRRPFFIQWDTGRSVRMGQAAAHHDVQLTGPVEVAIGGDVDEVATWLGGPVEGLALVGGPPGVQRLTIPTGAGPIVLA